MAINPRLIPTDSLKQRPEWLRVRLPSGENYDQLKPLMRSSSSIPSAKRRVAPISASAGSPARYLHDPRRASAPAAAASAPWPPGARWRSIGRSHARGGGRQRMGLQHAVITASTATSSRRRRPIFAATIRWIRRLTPNAPSKSSHPTSKARATPCKIVMDARPDIFNHNVETVPRLYKRVRPQADYPRSLDVLSGPRRSSRGAHQDRLHARPRRDPRRVARPAARPRPRDVDILTVGQYLRPSQQHLPIQRYATPDEFPEYARLGREMGFRHVDSGPLVRSSYHAWDQLREFQAAETHLA